MPATVPVWAYLLTILFVSTCAEIRYQMLLGKLRERDTNISVLRSLLAKKQKLIDENVSAAWKNQAASTVVPATTVKIIDAEFTEDK